MIRMLLLRSRESVLCFACAQSASETWSHLYVALQIDVSPSTANQEQRKTIPAFGGPRESDDGALPTGDHLSDVQFLSFSPQLACNCRDDTQPNQTKL